jgi:hypothetical protein
LEPTDRSEEPSAEPSSEPSPTPRVPSGPEVTDRSEEPSAEPSSEPSPTPKEDSVCKPCDSRWLDTMRMSRMNRNGECQERCTWKPLMRLYQRFGGWSCSCDNGV